MNDDKWRPRCPPARGLVTPRRLDPTGRSGPTRHQARRGRWRSTTHGYHVPSDTDSSVVEQRILEQSMRIVAAGAVTGWAALRLYGGAFFDGLATARCGAPRHVAGRSTRLRGHWCLPR